jgi:hypothetical protein
LAKKNQVPLYYEVSYLKQEPLLRHGERRGAWRDRVAPSYHCTVFVFERSPTGRLLEQSTNIEHSFELNIIHDKKTRRKEEKNASTWAVASSFNKILNPYVTHIIYIMLLQT